MPIEDPPRVVGKVVKGFGRGSKDLGWPTANLESADVDAEIAGLDRGVYCGWGSVNGSGPYLAVASLGINPTYSDVEKQVLELYFVHTFEEDFYGGCVRFIPSHYLRPEWKFLNDASEFNFGLLMEGIKSDVDKSVATFENISATADEAAFLAEAAAKRNCAVL
jgi:FAD synthase